MRLGTEGLGRGRLSLRARRQAQHARHPEVQSEAEAFKLQNQGLGASMNSPQPLANQRRKHARVPLETSKGLSARPDPLKDLTAEDGCNSPANHFDLREFRHLNPRSGYTVKNKVAIMPRNASQWSGLKQSASRWGLVVFALGCLGLGTPAPASEADARASARAVFQILAAELALQSGDTLLAAGAYLGLARQTQDPSVAERATQLALAVRSPHEALEAAEIWLSGSADPRSAQQAVDLLQLLLEQNDRLSASLQQRLRQASSAEQRAEFDDSLSQLALRGPRPEQGILLLDTVYSGLPQPSVALYTKAMLQERRGLFGEMEALLRSLLARDPNHAHALNALGYSMVDRNQSLAEAYALIRRAHTLLPQDPHIMDSLGWAYFRMNQLAQAQKWLEEAYRRLPDAEIAAHLGEVLWAQGRTLEAQRIWAEAHQRAPQNRVLLETLHRMGTRATSPLAQ